MKTIRALAEGLKTLLAAAAVFALLVAVYCLVVGVIA